jgi:transcriptional regulator with XRE-family HTH domain
MERSSLTPISCRMGRAALDWSQARLAHEAHVALRVLQAFESGFSRPHRNNLREIVLVFEAAGIEFLMHGGRILVLPPLSPVPIAAA